MDGFSLMKAYHIPQVCKDCGGVMVYKGVGEYQCEDCKAIDYDDYGKVRLFIEAHPGATAAQIESAVGVSQKTIRMLLKDGRIEIAENSRSFLRCEMCGKAIRYGELCSECEKNVHLGIEAKQREINRKNAVGVGVTQKGEEGQRRFIGRDNF